MTELAFDIRRAILLSAYMNHWGQPECRESIARDDERIELYTFPGDEDSNITRLSTIGLSACKTETETGTSNNDAELLLVLPKEVACEQTEKITHYLFDIASYVINTLETPLEIGTTIPESSLAPDGWPKALLFDEPRGEPEVLGSFQVGRQCIDLFWLIPIYGGEYQVIKRDGLKVFDELAESSSISLVDVDRPDMTLHFR